MYGKDFQETVEPSDMKVGTYSQINDYMTIYDNPRSRSFTDLCPRSFGFNTSKFFSSKKKKKKKKNIEDFYDMVKFVS